MPNEGIFQKGDLRVGFLNEGFFAQAFRPKKRTIQPPAAAPSSPFRFRRRLSRTVSNSLAAAPLRAALCYIRKILKVIYKERLTVKSYFQYRFFLPFKVRFYPVFLPMKKALALPRARALFFQRRKARSPTLFFFLYSIRLQVTHARPLTVPPPAGYNNRTPFPS